MALKFRRGSTSQQSGSLAFGEPYFNTDYNTLVVGGQSGDIVLAAAGTSSTFIGSSVSASNYVSASNLKITGNASIDGNVTIGGTITIGDQSTDTINVVASLSSSLIPSETNTFDLGSATKIWRDLYISTGSIKIVDPGTSTVVGTLTSNANGDLHTAGEISSSTIAGLGNATQYSASVATTIGNLSSSVATSISASLATINIDSSSLEQSILNLSSSAATSFSASLASQTVLSASVASTDSTQTTNITNAQTSANNTFASASAYSASAAVVANTNADSAAGAFASASAYSASAAVVANTNADSAAGAFASASAYSASAYTTITNLSSSIATTDSNASSSAYSTFAKLSGGNVFNGTQTITGSLYISSNLVVQGSSSLQNITASAASIGTNTVILNTSTPSIRFGGISVVDSGSNAGESGSLFWDSVENHWIYQHPLSSGAPYKSAILISGPKNSGSLGSEIGLTLGQVPVAIGDDHIGDSIISASATKVTIAGGLDVTGNISASTFTGLGNLTTYSASVASRVNTLETAGYAVSSSVASATATSISTLSASIYTTDATQTTNITTAQNSANGAFASASAYSASAAVVANTNANSAAGAFASASAYSASLASTISTNSGSAYTSISASNANVTAISGAFANNTVTFNGSAIKLGGSATITATATNALTIGTGLSGTSYNGSTAVTIANTGVTSITGTANQVVASASTGGVTLSLPQSIATTSAVTFASVTATGDIVAYSTSDRRHKNNIQIIGDALSKVTKLNGVTWEWNDDVDAVTKQSPKTGLIAQEVQEVLPEVVTERENGFLGLDYSKMVGLLVEAIKEQQNQIHSLTLEIEKLKKDNSL